MTFEGAVPAYNGHFDVVGGDLTGSTWDYGSDELCVLRTPPNSFVVTCGAQQGDPHVICEGLAEAPEALVTVPDGWDEGMEVSINTTTPPILLEASASFPVLDGQPLLTQVGWTRVRVLARGRAAARADGETPEVYLIAAWPEAEGREPTTLNQPREADAELIETSVVAQAPSATTAAPLL